MSHDHDFANLETATYALLPVLLMLWIEMALNHFFAPQNAIFLSPYLLAYFISVMISFVVLWKGQICPGQTGRLRFVLPFLLVFALGNFLYTLSFTPKHTPMLISLAASLFLPFIYWKLPDDEALRRTLILCGLAMAGIGVLQYLVIYWYELPSLFNGIRANNFAQLLLGILLAGWYLVLAKSRLEGFLKLLVLLALAALVLNYLWTAFVLYQQWQRMPEMALLPYFLFFAAQFVIFALLAWLLLAKKIKNPTAWTAATGLAMLYPLTNIV